MSYVVDLAAVKSEENSIQPEYNQKPKYLIKSQKFHNCQHFPPSFYLMLRDTIHETRATKQIRDSYYQILVSLIKSCILMQLWTLTSQGDKARFKRLACQKH